MRIIFLGTPDFSVAALEALIAAGHEIVCVYTQPPRAAGRGKAARKTPVHLRAEALGLAVRVPENFKAEEEREALAALEADVAVVVAYGLLLPLPVLEAPRLGCLNIHASLLPRWRGAAPIQRAIMAGDTRSGVSIMQMEAGLDTGPVYEMVETVIEADETAESLHDRLAALGAAAIAEVLEDLERRTATPQAEIGVTYAKKIDKAETRVDWNQSAAVIDRHIRGLSPFPGAWTMIEGRRVKLLLSKVEAGKGAPGEVLDGSLLIAAADGAVRILRAQREGKKAATAEEFLRGFPVSKAAQIV